MRLRALRRHGQSPPWLTRHTGSDGLRLKHARASYRRARPRSAQRPVRGDGDTASAGRRGTTQTRWGGETTRPRRRQTPTSQLQVVEWATRLCLVRCPPASLALAPNPLSFTCFPRKGRSREKPPRKPSPGARGENANAWRRGTCTMPTRHTDHQALDLSASSSPPACR